MGKKQQYPRIRSIFIEVYFKGGIMGEEKNYENKIKRWLQSKGIYALGSVYDPNKAIGYYEKRFGCSFTPSGLPDMHICINGYSIEVELKATNGRPSPLQLRCIEQINTSGGKALLLYPKNFEEFKEVIECVVNMTRLKK